MAYIEKREGRTKPYRVRYRDAAGKIVSESFKRRSDAQKRLHTLEADRARGRWVDPRSGKRPFGPFAHEVMESKLNLRSSTRARDESHLRNHILPAFESVSLARIDRRAVQKWVQGLSESLAPRTVRECYRILGGVMREAVHRRLIVESPCERVTLPRVVKAEKRYLSVDEINALADAIDARYRALILTGAYLGLRWGELAGLKRENVNLLKRQVRIVGALERVGNGWEYSEELKTTAARRTLSLPDFLVDVLAKHLEEARESEWLFPAPEGGFLRYHGFRKRFWNPAVEVSGIEYATPHALRHTAAALMIDQGANPLIVQKRLGHSDIRITLGTYGHLFPDRDEDVVDSLDSLWRESEAERTAPHTRPKVTALESGRA